MHLMQFKPSEVFATMKNGSAMMQNFSFVTAMMFFYALDSNFGIISWGRNWEKHRHVYTSFVLFCSKFAVLWLHFLLNKFFQVPKLIVNLYLSYQIQLPCGVGGVGGGRLDCSKEGVPGYMNQTISRNYYQASSTVFNLLVHTSTARDQLGYKF
jgi:hypothetical protein